jgi:hypothetical protein
MTLGTVLAGSFRLLRRDPRTTLGPALVVSIVTTAIGSLGQWFVSVWAVDELSTSTYTDDLGSVFLAIAMLGLLAGVLPAAVSLAANAILQGMIVIVVSRGLLGERIGFPGIRRRIRGRVGALVGWAALAFAAAMTVVALVVVVVIGLGSLGTGGIVLAVLLGILLVLGAIVLAILLGVKLGFVSPALVLERAPLGAAIRRSWALTRGFFWRLLGIQLLVAVMIGIATSIVVTPVSFAVSLITGLTLPNGGDVATYETLAGVNLAVTGFFTAIAGAFGLVIQTATTGLLYVDTRMRREGLDLVLARYVEDRQRSAATHDPFPAPGAP